MATSMPSNLKHDVITVHDLVKQYQNGQISVPEFQRDYVWKPSKAPKLIDSLYRDFPISSLLIWESGDGDVNARSAASARGKTSWLIDGQQRVTTLARVKDGALDVVFDVEHEQFQLESAATRKDKNFFHVSELWDDEGYRRSRNSLPQTGYGERLERRVERVRDILRYEVPYVKMSEHSFDDAVTAFKAINTLGVKLKKEDIESAQVAARHSGFIRDEVVP